MAFRCSSCPYSTDLKSNLIRHLHRKKSTCDSTIPLKEYNKFPCRNEGCDAVFAHLTGRVRHEKSRCKFGAAILKTQTPSPQIQGNNNNSIAGNNNATAISSPNATINSPTINININCFDLFQPDIDKDRFFQVIKNSSVVNAILEFVKDNQFNTDKPENMNCFISNLKDLVARVYDGETWKVRKGKEVVDDVFEKYQDAIDRVLEEIEEETETLDQKYKKLIQKYRVNTNHDAFEGNIKEKIILLLYNLRNIVKDMHNVKQRVTVNHDTS